MTLAVHKMIEILTPGRAPDGPEEAGFAYLDDPCETTLRGTIAACLHVAEKFEFASFCPFESDEIKEYGHLLAGAGLLQAPYPISYFEGDFPGKLTDNRGVRILRWGILALEVPQTSDYKIEDREGTFDKLIVCRTLAYGTSDGHPRAKVLRAALVYQDTVNGFGSVRETDEGTWPFPFDYPETPGGDGELCTASSFAACVGFMDLKETDVREEKGPAKLNAARTRKGKPPLYGHKVLTISNAAREAAREHSGKIISRRAHWRRGHLRHLPTGIVPVRPALVRGEGFVSKDYRV